MRKLGLCVLATAITLGVCATPAVADDTECVGALTGTHDNVVVPPGANCTLTGAIVKGNVTALRGSSLGTNLSQIGGNIEARRPRFVGSAGDVIGGNFAVTGATGDPGFAFPPFNISVFICGSELPGGNIVVKRSVNGTVAVGSPQGFACAGNTVEKGNIQVEENIIPPLEALAVGRNTVGGNVQVFKNRGPGQKTVVENVVRQNLQCRRNDEPFVGQPNVAGKAEGQCSAAPPGAAATLTGETLRQHTAFDGTTTGNCSTDQATGETSYSFDFSGFATGPYPGTFTEHIDVTIGPPGAPLPIEPFPDPVPPGPNPSQFLAAGQLLSFDATFTIQSPNGDVSGSKTLFAVMPADATHAGVCAEFTDMPSPFGPVSGVYKDVRAFNLVYEATISTPDGTFTDEGTSQAQGRQGRIVGSQGAPLSDVNDFGQTFQSSLTEPAPGG